MKNLIYILVLSLFIFNCSNDDDESNSTNTTFLEIYESTVWLNNEDSDWIYIRFINNINTPLEYWVETYDCYYYFLENSASENFIITENSNDLLEIRYVANDGGVDYLDIIKLTFSDNRLKVESKYYEDESLVESDIQYLQISNEDVDNFIICDD